MSYILKNFNLVLPKLNIFYLMEKISNNNIKNKNILYNY